MVSPSSSQTERFDTGGRAGGWIGVVGAVGLVVFWFAQLGDPLPVPVLTGAVLAALLCWAVIIRPAVSVHGEVLELRNVLTTVRVPLAAVEGLVLRQVLVVRVGERRLVATGVGRSQRRSAVTGRPGRRPGRADEPSDAGRVPQVVDAADYAETRLTGLVADARTRAGVVSHSAEQAALAEGVEHQPTWYVVVLLGLALVAFVASCWL